MSVPIRDDAPPLSRDSSGALRVGQSRVLLELVIRASRDGATPSAIVGRYPTTTVAEVEAVLDFATRHPESIERYLDEREDRAEEVREKVEGQQPDLGALRRRLLARRSP